MIPPFKKRLNVDITSRLKDIGFEKKGIIYVFSNNQDSALSLNITSRRSYEKNVIVLSVHVGVSIQSVNRLFIRLNNLPEKNRYISEYMFIVGSNLGYLMPEKGYKEWFFNEFTYSEETLNEMVDTIKKYAFHYYEGRNSLESLCHYVYETNEINTQIRRDEYYPIILYLSDKKNEAIRYVTQIRDSKRYEGPDGENYIRFTENFLQLTKM